MLNFIKKIKTAVLGIGYKRISLLLILVTACILAPEIVHAEEGKGFVAGLFGNLIDFAAGAIGKLFFGISWLIGLIGAFIVGILIWVLQIIIFASGNIVNSPAVQIGFPIILSIANLGLVFAVILIAVATILQNQTYNVKKLLANLIIMAVLVNFGLVISGAILGFSNRITNYFLDSMTGGTMNLASTIAGVVNPQRAITSVSTVTNEEGELDSDTSHTTPATGGGAETVKLGGTTLGSFITPITGVWLSLAITIILIVSFFSLIASFVIRYLKLVFLLILLPAAWMGSILPGTTAGWSGTWWKKFTELAFYPPIVLFFLWLALRIGENASYKKVFALPEGSKEFAGDFVAGILQELLNQIVMVGIIVGGDYAAKFAGAAASGAGVDAAMKMKGWATGKVKRAGTRAGTRLGTAALASRPAQGIAKGVGSFGARLSNAGLSGEGGKFRQAAGKIFGAPIRGFGGLAVAGQGALKGSEKALSAQAGKSYRDEVAKYGDDEFLIRAKAATGIERAAYLEKASKDPKLMSKLMDVPGFKEGINKDVPGEKDLYERYGFKDAHEAALLQSGHTIKDKLPAFDDAKKKYEEAKKNGPVSEEAEKEFVKAEKEFTDAIKKLSADGANGLIFAKEKDSNGKPTDTFVMPKEQREAAMQQLITKGGWNPGTFTEFLKKAQEGNNVDEVRKLIEGMDPGRINPAAIKAMKNGAMKNLGVGGEDVFGKELFEKAKEKHGVEDENKKPKVTFSE